MAENSEGFADSERTTKWKAPAELTPKSKRPYEWFPIKSSKMYALIINVLNDRLGAENDDKTLKELLIKCNFNIMKCTDFSVTGIKETVAKFRSTLQRNKGNIDGCIVALMSHGTTGDRFQTYSADGNHALLNIYKDFVNQLNLAKCPYLLDVPKVFLVNMCRGPSYDLGSGTSNKNKEYANTKTESSQPGCPEWMNEMKKDCETEDSSSSISGSSLKDTLIGYPSFIDCEAYRSPEKGSYYIQLFCEEANYQIKEFGPTHIKTILENVNKKLRKIPMQVKNEESKKFETVYQTSYCLDVVYGDNMLYLAEGGSTLRRLDHFYENPKKEKTRKSPIKFGLLVSAPNFAGRDDELKNLKDNFESKTNLVLVCGIGGIGKTELCKKFASVVCLASKVSCVWLAGETKATLRDSVIGLAKELGVSNKANPGTLKYFEYLLTVLLPNSDRLLVVIDNVDEIYDEVQDLIQKSIKNANNKNMTIIVTSRDKNLFGGAGSTVGLNDLCEHEAINMLKGSISGSTKAEAKQLANRLGCFPLALQQAIGYIKCQRKKSMTRNYSVSDYIADFEIEMDKLLGHELNGFELAYDKTTLATWKLTLDQLNVDQLEMLKILAFLEPDVLEEQFFYRIWANFINKQTFQYSWSEKVFHDALDAVSGYCLIQIQTDKLEVAINPFISIHRLVQDVIRLTYVPNPQEYSKELFGSLLHCTGRYPDGRRGGLIVTEIAHLNRVAKFAGIMISESEQLSYFHEVLLCLLENNMLEIATMYAKQHFCWDKCSSLEKEGGTKEFLEKVYLCSLVHDYDDNQSVTTEMIKSGTYDISDDSFSHYHLEHKSLEKGLEMSRKHFGEDSKLTVFLLKVKGIKVKYGIEVKTCWRKY